MEQKYLTISTELEKRGIRPTHQRLKLLEFFYEHPNHPTVDDIFKAIKPHMPTMTKATIYNNLKLFVQKEMLVEVHIEDNEVRYDLSSKSHGHFKCIECGTIYDFVAEIDELPTAGLDEFQIDNKNVYFRGVCHKCLSKRNMKK